MPLTLACFISSSVISMRFFLKATTRLPLKIVSSGCWERETKSSSNRRLVGRSGKRLNKATSFMRRDNDLSSQSRRACQTSAGTAAGAPRPVGCPCSSGEPYPKPCWSSRSLPVPWPACTEGPGQIEQKKKWKEFPEVQQVQLSIQIDMWCFIFLKKKGARGG